MRLWSIQRRLVQNSREVYRDLALLHAPEARLNLQLRQIFTNSYSKLYRSPTDFAQVWGTVAYLRARYHRAETSLKEPS